MNKKHRITSLLLMLMAVPAFAQSILPTGMTTLMTSVLEVFTGDFTRMILVVCLCGCAVAYGFNKDNEKMKRNIIAIGVAIAILGTSSFIVEKIWEASRSS